MTRHKHPSSKDCSNCYTTWHKKETRSTKNGWRTPTELTLTFGIRMRLRHELGRSCSVQPKPRTVLACTEVSRYMRTLAWRSKMPAEFRCFCGHNFRFILLNSPQSCLRHWSPFLYCYTCPSWLPFYFSSKILTNVSVKAGEICTVID